MHELQLREEQQEQELRNRRAQAAEEAAARAREREKQSIIQELVSACGGTQSLATLPLCSGHSPQMMSDRPASEVVASHIAASAHLEEEAGQGGVASSVRKDLTQPTFLSQMVSLSLARDLLNGHVLCAGYCCV